MERSVKRVETAQPPGRSAPTHANRMVIAPDDFAAHSPFLMMAEDWFAPPWLPHPSAPRHGDGDHRAGRPFEHRDHTGGRGLLQQGDVQWMTAGKGVLHSEMPGPEGVHSLQLWLNLPGVPQADPGALRRPARRRRRPGAGRWLGGAGLRRPPGQG